MWVSRANIEGKQCYVYSYSHHTSVIPHSCCNLIDSIDLDQCNSSSFKSTIISSSFFLLLVLFVSFDHPPQYPMVFSRCSHSNTPCLSYVHTMYKIPLQIMYRQTINVCIFLFSYNTFLQKRLKKHRHLVK